jgi:2-iminobutanoate/2-iminopropanoate deaminase
MRRRSLSRDTDIARITSHHFIASPVRVALKNSSPPSSRRDTFPTVDHRRHRGQAASTNYDCESNAMKSFLTVAYGMVCGVLFFTAAHAAETSSSQPVTRQVIRTPDAPSSPLYSQAIKAGSTIYVTGVPAYDPATNKVVGSTIQEQTRRALISCQNILRAAGATLANVVEVQVLLARPDDFAGLNEEYAKFFATDPPVRSVTRLGPELPGVLVSIRMVAVVSN